MLTSHFMPCEWCSAELKQKSLATVLMADLIICLVTQKIFMDIKSKRGGRLPVFWLLIIVYLAFLLKPGKCPLYFLTRFWFNLVRMQAHAQSALNHKTKHCTTCCVKLSLTLCLEANSPFFPPLFQRCLSASCVPSFCFTLTLLILNTADMTDNPILLYNKVCADKDSHALPPLTNTMVRLLALLRLKWQRK